MAGYTMFKVLGDIPKSESRIELCHSRDKSIVWLQLTNFWDKQIPHEYVPKESGLATAIIGAHFSPNKQWNAIDFSTANLNRSISLTFGKCADFNILKFQLAILKDWDRFNSGIAVEFLKGLTFGKSSSSASFVMAALKTGFSAVGLALPAHSGIRTADWTTDDAIKYLKLNAAQNQIEVIDAGLGEFKSLDASEHADKTGEDTARSGDVRDIAFIKSNKVHGGRFAYSDVLSSLSIPRVNAYGFRGDSRTPSEIKNAGGFNPNQTRDEQLINAEKDHKDAIKWRKDGGGMTMNSSTALNLPVFLKNQFLGGFISVTKSIAVAKSFACGMGGTTSRNPGWVYACFVEGGFEIPKVDNLITFDGKDVPVPYNEQEIAMPGLIEWEDVVACRAVDRDGWFKGRIFIRQSFYSSDKEAFHQIYRLLNGQSQGTWVEARKI